MFGIATPGGHRGQTTLDWRLKALLLSAAAAGGGAATGAALGWLSAALTERSRVTFVSLAAALLGGVALWHLFRGSARLLERDCETAQAWLGLGAVGWAVRNGAALGCGFSSRIGILSYYAIPVASMGFGDPGVGAAIFGLYGAARGLAVWLWFGAFRLGGGVAPDTLAESVFGYYGLAKRVGALVLLAVSTTAFVIVGI